MLLERMHKFGHIVTTMARDKSTGKYQSFSRGEANIIINMCSGKLYKPHISKILDQITANIINIASNTCYFRLLGWLEDRSYKQPSEEQHYGHPVSMASIRLRNDWLFL